MTQHHKCSHSGNEWCPECEVGGPYSNDDDTPISIEWLESLGFQRCGYSMLEKGRWIIFITPEGDPPGTWQVRFEGAVMNRYRRFDTREDLLDLWEILKVPFLCE